MKLQVFFSSFFRFLFLASLALALPLQSHAQAFTPGTPVYTPGAIPGTGTITQSISLPTNGAALQMTYNGPIQNVPSGGFTAQNSPLGLGPGSGGSHFATNFDYNVISPQGKINMQTVGGNPQDLVVNVQGQGLSLDTANGEPFADGFQAGQLVNPVTGQPNMVVSVQNTGSGDISTTTPTGSKQFRLVPCDGVDCTIEKLKDLGVNIFNWLMGLGGIAAVGAIVVAGSQYVLAGGDSGKMADAKQKLYLAILGLVILLTTVVVVNTVLRVLGVTGETQGKIREVIHE